ncbi:hypothetical protein PR048_020859 [Dryococelus australis]|uniref:Uncharacterized protein n=1 Tax=Dryococelus australis TaxID=614101 RepID=A0ABQ9GWP6_9NEOP|nr:hypothetical protein PR048_020859 [Dryococelus australis]
MSKINPRSITGNRHMHTEDDYKSVEKPRVGLSYRRKFERPEAEQINIMCYACHEVGYIARVCPNVTTEEKNNKTKPDHKGRSRGTYNSKSGRAAEGAVATAHFKALCGNKLSQSCKAVWIMDSGTTHHMTPYRERIKDFGGSLTGTVILANGECAAAKGKGKVPLIMTEKFGGWTIQLREIIYVPELENNVMYVNQLDEKKLELRIKDGDIKVMDGNEMIFKTFSGGSDVYLVSYQAYSPNGKIVKCDSVKCNLPTGMTTMKSAVTWHRRMGHLTSLPAVCDTSNSYRDCDMCLKGKMFWAEVLSTTNYIRNRCPSQAIGNQIPFQLWFDKHLTVDDIKRIYIFGCQVWAATLKNGKLSSRADECIFTGFQEGIKGYRFWILSHKIIIVSRDMCFYEDVFHFKTPCPAKRLVHEQENVVEMPAVEERNEDEDCE